MTDIVKTIIMFALVIALIVGVIILGITNSAKAVGVDASNDMSNSVAKPAIYRVP